MQLKDEGATRAGSAPREKVATDDGLEHEPAAALAAHDDDLWGFPTEGVLAVRGVDVVAGQGARFCDAVRFRGRG